MIVSVTLCLGIIFAWIALLSKARLDQNNYYYRVTFLFCLTLRLGIYSY